MRTKTVRKDEFHINAIKDKLKKDFAEVIKVFEEEFKKKKLIRKDLSIVFTISTNVLGIGGLTQGGGKLRTI